MSKNQNNDKLAQKRAAVTGETKKKAPGSLLFLGIIVVAGIFFALFLKGETAPVVTAEPGARPPARAASAATEGEVRFPASQFADGVANFFEHTAADGTRIRYFILKSDDGEIRAAFDACDSCWPAGKGYKQDGDEMVCQNCRMRFASNKINEVKGGCNPSPLKRSMEGGEVVIQVRDIEAGANYFKPEGKGD